MIPWIAYGAVVAAAAFLSGCGEDSNKRKELTPQAPPPEPRAPQKQTSKSPLDAGAKANPNPLPNPVSDAAPKHVFLPISMTLRGHFKAFDAYQSLKGEGVSLADLDKGCHIHDEVKGQADWKIEACEVYEYVFGNYKKFPRIAQSIIGRPLPWVLDDKDPLTDFDELVRHKIDQALAELKRTPALKELEPDSPEYREKLAFALFYFAGFPEKAPRHGPAKNRWLELTRKLRFLGLHDFQGYLFQNGGLGTHGFNRGRNRIYVRGALEALQDKKGGDAAKSNVLFAVFDQAGLNPYFTKVPYRFAHSQKDFTISSGRGSNIYQSEYTGIGISLGGTDQLFHPDELIELSGLTQNAPIRSLRQYVGNYLNDLGEDLFEYTGKREEALDLNNQGMKIYPENGDAYVFMAQLQDEKEKSITYLRGLEQDPNNWFLNINFAIHLEEDEKNYEKSLRYYSKALDLNADFFTQVYLEAAKKVAQRVREKNPRNMLARKVLGKIDNIQEERRAPTRRRP